MIKSRSKRSYVIILIVIVLIDITPVVTALTPSSTAIDDEISLNLRNYHGITIENEQTQVFWAIWYGTMPSPPDDSLSFSLNISTLSFNPSDHPIDFGLRQISCDFETEVFGFLDLDSLNYSKNFHYETENLRSSNTLDKPYIVHLSLVMVIRDFTQSIENKRFDATFNYNTSGHSIGSAQSIFEPDAQKIRQNLSCLPENTGFSLPFMLVEPEFLFFSVLIIIIYIKKLKY